MENVCLCVCNFRRVCVSQCVCARPCVCDCNFMSAQRMCGQVCVSISFWKREREREREGGWGETDRNWTVLTVSVCV